MVPATAATVPQPTGASAIVSPMPLVPAITTQLAKFLAREQSTIT